MKLIYSVFPMYRKACYNVSTSIYKDGDLKLVTKRALNNKSIRHIEAILENKHILANLYGENCVPKVKQINDTTIEMEYISGTTLMSYMQHYLSENDTNSFFELLCFYVENILKGGDGDHFDGELLSNPYDKNRGVNIDLTFDNIIMLEDGIKIIDFEWLYPDIPLKFVLFRVLAELYTRNNYLCDKNGLSFDKLLDMVGILPLKEEYLKLANDWWLLLQDGYLARYKKTRYLVQNTGI